MAVQVIWAEPGPAADEAWRRYWALCHEVAAETIRRREPDGAAGCVQSNEKQRKTREPA